ncbi:uncharacterized protein METZ01_LOCUS399350 [marine metagenome]|uniref:Ribosomal RNA small subunit methyltransferase G n=1 Tax=marine metagenome TaxID=408172 RepID=A0A382VIY4_9ZZZZ
MQGPILHILQDPRLGLDIEASLVVSRIEQYLQLLLKWNQKINLTAEKDPEEILKKHVFDSLQYSRAIELGFRVMDIGSGAGFPGIPIKIIFPELQLVLVESQRKRCSFLETVVRDLEMEQVKVFNARAEDIPGNQAGQFDLVVFRAVLGVQECLNLSERFLPSGGRVVLKKNPRENLKRMVSNPRFLLQKEVSITSYHGVVSNLLVFEKCST